MGLGLVRAAISARFAHALGPLCFLLLEVPHVAPQAGCDAIFRAQYKSVAKFKTGLSFMTPRFDLSKSKVLVAPQRAPTESSLGCGSCFATLSPIGRRHRYFVLYATRACTPVRVTCIMASMRPRLVSSRQRNRYQRKQAEKLARVKAERTREGLITDVMTGVTQTLRANRTGESTAGQVGHHSPLARIRLQRHIVRRHSPRFGISPRRNRRHTSWNGSIG